MIICLLLEDKRTWSDASNYCLQFHNSSIQTLTTDDLQGHVKVNTTLWTGLQKITLLYWKGNKSNFTGIIIIINMYSFDLIYTHYSKLSCKTNFIKYD